MEIEDREREEELIPNSTCGAENKDGVQYNLAEDRGLQSRSGTRRFWEVVDDGTGSYE